MTHLPLTPGDYTTASGFTPRIVRIGKYGKFAFGANGEKWHVETGKHYRDAAHDITGRAEPAPAHDSVTAEGMALVRDRVAKDMAGRTFTPMVEASRLDAVTAQRDWARQQTDTWIAKLDTERAKRIETTGKLTEAQARHLAWFRANGPTGMIPIAGPSRAMIKRLIDAGWLAEVGPRRPMTFVQYDLTDAGRAALAEHERTKE